MCIRDRGSVCETLAETVDFLNKNGQKVGLIKVRLYRPFVNEKLVAAIPDSVKTIDVYKRQAQ